MSVCVNECLRHSALKTEVLWFTLLGLRASAKLALELQSLQNALWSPATTERSALAQMSPAWRAHTSGNVMMNCASR